MWYFSFLVNVSMSGLEAALTQKSSVVSFASKSLTDTEKKYSQFEKELHAIVLGCCHFHQYLCGRLFTIITDHKPLEILLNRPINKSSPRLRRMLLQIQPYDYNIKFQPGKDIPLADALSRLHINTEDQEMQTNIECCVASVMKLLPISTEKPTLKHKKPTLIQSLPPCGNALKTAGQQPGARFQRQQPNFGSSETN